MQILLEADTKSTLGVQEVKWEVLPVKEKGGRGSRIGQESLRLQCISDTQPTEWGAPE